MKPRRLELDYVATPRRPLWLGMLVLAAALGIGAELFARYQDAQLELARLQAMASLVSPQRQAVRSVPKERLDAEVRAAEAVVRQLTLPWAALIETLERAATREVAVLQLQPDAHTRVLRLTAEARNREAMFAYVRRLAAAQSLAEVHVVSHQVQQDNPQKPIQFAVHAAIKAAP
jgi:Tfp pilus assembly protein PilN